MIRASRTLRGRLLVAASFTLALSGTLAVGLGPSACRRQSAARTRPPDDGAAGAPGAGAAQSQQPLPEDPAAGRQSHEQWLAQMDFEERERQLGYDRRKLDEHRAMIAVLVAARKRFDAARTPAALAKVTARTPALLEDAQRRIAAIDHWGNNSRLLPDYQALLKALSESYPSAVTAALAGDRHALLEARAEMDRRFASMRAWLKAAEESEDE